MADGGHLGIWSNRNESATRSVILMKLQVQMHKMSVSAWSICHIVM